jgi:AraC family transcriptional regulator of adaptative response/methylated-DNA-[protein]-cysteine methyltransferase
MTEGARMRVGSGSGELGPRAIGFASSQSPLGRVLVAVTTDGVCAIMLGDDEASLLGALRRQEPGASLAANDPDARALADAIATYIAGRGPSPATALDQRGTPFQRRVWAALVEVPESATVTYTELASRIGSPAAYRAVANACGANRIAVLVPCHRAVRADGGPGGYRWGVERKRALLECERAARV